MRLRRRPYVEPEPVASVAACSSTEIHRRLPSSRTLTSTTICTSSPSQPHHKSPHKPLNCTRSVTPDCSRPLAVMAYPILILLIVLVSCCIAVAKAQLGPLPSPSLTPTTSVSTSLSSFVPTTASVSASLASSSSSPSSSFPFSSLPIPESVSVSASASTPLITSTLVSVSVSESASASTSKSTSSPISTALASASASASASTIASASASKSIDPPIPTTLASASVSALASTSASASTFTSASISASPSQSLPTASASTSVVSPSPFRNRTDLRPGDVFFQAAGAVGNPLLRAVTGPFCPLRALGSADFTVLCIGTEATKKAVFRVDGVRVKRDKKPPFYIARYKRGRTRKWKKLLPVYGQPFQLSCTLNDLALPTTVNITLLCDDDNGNSTTTPTGTPTPTQSLSASATPTSSSPSTQSIRGPTLWFRPANVPLLNDTPAVQMSSSDTFCPRARLGTHDFSIQCAPPRLNASHRLQAVTFLVDGSPVRTDFDYPYFISNDEYNTVNHWFLAYEWAPASERPFNITCILETSSPPSSIPPSTSPDNFRSVVSVSALRIACEDDPPTLFLTAAGTKPLPADAAMQLNNGSTFCPSTLIGTDNFSIECRTGAAVQSAEFRIDGALARIDEDAPFFLSNDTAADVASWTAPNRRVNISCRTFPSGSTAIVSNVLLSCPTAVPSSPTSIHTPTPTSSSPSPSGPPSAATVLPSPDPLSSFSSSSQPLATSTSTTLVSATVDAATTATATTAPPTASYSTPQSPAPSTCAAPSMETSAPSPISLTPTPR